MPRCGWNEKAISSTSKKFCFKSVAAPALPGNCSVELGAVEQQDGHA